MKSAQIKLVRVNCIKLHNCCFVKRQIKQTAESKAYIQKKTSGGSAIWGKVPGVKECNIFKWHACTTHTHTRARTRTQTHTLTHTRHTLKLNFSSVINIFGRTFQHRTKNNNNTTCNTTQYIEVISDFGTLQEHPKVLKSSCNPNYYMLRLHWKK